MAFALDTLEYARRLRECGFSEQQAEGQARALAAAMTESFAMKQDLEQLETRLASRFQQIDARFEQIDARFEQIDARFEQIDARFEALEKHFEIRLVELEKRFELRLDARLADLERRMTFRLGGMMVATAGIFSTLVKLL